MEQRFSAAVVNKGSEKVYAVCHQAQINQILISDPPTGSLTGTKTPFTQTWDSQTLDGGLPGFSCYYCLKQTAFWVIQM